jgi:hypothetical protein
MVRCWGSILVEELYFNRISKFSRAALSITKIFTMQNLEIFGDFKISLYFPLDRAEFGKTHA